MSTKNIVIFASGKGSNAQAIIDYFRNNSSVHVALIVTNNPEAGVLEIAQREKIDAKIISNKNLKELVTIADIKCYNPTLIILAGYMQKIPNVLLEVLQIPIINIHPALLPNYGGKGMYGMNVHNAVIAAKESQSGITIHYVNEHYDEGNIILQATCDIDKEDTPEDLANKIHYLEHYYYPRAIEFLLK